MLAKLFYFGRDFGTHMTETLQSHITLQFPEFSQSCMLLDTKGSFSATSLGRDSRMQMPMDGAQWFRIVFPGPNSVIFERVVICSCFIFVRQVTQSAFF